MKAVGYYRALPTSDPKALVDLDLPQPTPGPRDLRVRVFAVSVNPADTKLRASESPPPGHPRVLGFDAAGIVDAAGDRVMLFKPGDEVFYAGAIDRPGSNAEFQLVDERLVARKPMTMDWAHAAAMPLTSITAWELLFDRLRVPYGEKTRAGTLLIINGAGGVGSMLIQLARRLTGLTVIATASRPETIEWVQRLGAHHVIDHRKPLDEGLAALGIRDVDYVASLTGTDRQVGAIARLMAPEGVLAMIDDPPTLDVMPLKLKSITIAWELMFTRSLFQTAKMIEQHRILAEIATLVDSGLLQSTLTECSGPINAANLRAIHLTLDAGRAIGKHVLVGF